MKKSQSCYKRHDCRLESTKSFIRDKSHEVSLMTTLMKQTNQSLNYIYDGYFSNQTKPDDDKKFLNPLKLSREGSFVTDLSNLSKELKKQHDKKSEEKEPIEEDKLEDFDDINEIADMFLLKFASKDDSKKPRLSIDEKTNLIQRENYITKLLKESTINSYNKDYGNLEWCRALVINMNGDIICADSMNHRLLVFNSQLIFKFELGKRGNQANEFNEPVDLALDQIGRLFVADKNNCRIEVYEEKKLMKQINIQFNTLNGVDVKKKSSKSNIRSFKAGSFYKYVNTINLGESYKPIKLVTSPYACVLACSTENGFVFIINESLEIISYTNMKQPYTQFDLKCICLNENGTELINLKRVQNDEYLLKFFNVDPTMTIKQTERIRKLKMARKYRLQKNYLPGIDIGLVKLIKLSTDTSFLAIYDSLNLNLLEFNMSGNYRRILIKATHNLTNCLAFDYNKQLLLNSNRQHLVTSEYELNPSYKFKYRDNAFKGNFDLIAAIVKRSDDDDINLNENYLQTNELLRTRTIDENKYLFKLKIYSF